MPSPSLDAETAASFLKKLGEHIDYNINIMDREGVIIASRDPSRVGSFHDAAKRLVATGARSEIVEEGPSLPAGVKPGVNLPIVYKGETVGVVGVTGRPGEIEPLAYAVKTSVESMLELEVWKDRALRRQDRKNLLINYLLHDDGASHATVEGLALKLGYTPGLLRVPIVLVPSRAGEAAEILKSVKANALHSTEDISWTTPEGSILVFKSLRLEGEGILARFEAEVGAYVDAARASAGAAAGGLKAYAGACQSDLGRYGMAFRQVLWLQSRYPDAGEEVVYLFEHLLEYFASCIPRAELVAAFDAAAALLPAELRRGLGISVQALTDSALNGKEAAARLGVHRNTFAARMDRIAGLLGKDPRRDPRALDFLALLSRYLDLSKGPGGQEGKASR